MKNRGPLQMHPRRDEEVKAKTYRRRTAEEVADVALETTTWDLESPPKDTDVHLKPAARRSPRRRIAAGALVAFVGLVAGVAVIFPEQFKHQIEISIVRQPTPYTQLFFSNPTSLPTTLDVTRSTYFEFTVVNDQGHAMLYRYSVKLAYARRSTLVAKGSLWVGNNQSIKRAITIDPRVHKARYLITVELSNVGQSIHFYGETQ
jgi:hypothetical protein